MYATLYASIPLSSPFPTTDPLEIDFPQSQQSMNWFYNPTAVPDNIRALNDTVTSCDALIALTAEYNFSIPPAFANIVDNLPPSTFTWKPCAIVSYSLSKSRDNCC